MDKTILIMPENGLQFDWKAIASNPSAQHEPMIDINAYKAIYINNAGIDKRIIRNAIMNIMFIFIKLT